MKRINWFDIAAIAAILFISGSASADSVEIDKIVVTPSRIEEDSTGVARNVDVITQKDIERTQAADISELLTGLTSVNVSNYGGIGATKTIRMRGSTAAQVLVLVDGRPINNPRDGTAELSSIPLDNIERVEVMHGPGSSLYGAGAMAGTVNIITKSPPREGQKTELTSSFGTFRTYNEVLSHGARVSKFGYLISGGLQSYEGYRANSMFNAKDVNTKFEYEFSKNNILTLNSGFYKSRSGAPGRISDPDIDDKQVITKNFQDLNWRFSPDDTTGLSMKVYQNYDRLQFIENTAGSIFDIAGKVDTHTTRARGYDLQLSKKLIKNYQAVCGFNYVTNLNDSTSSAKHEYTVRAGYLENKLDLFDRLKLNFGARLDDYSNFGTEVNPSFNALYELTDNMRIRGSISRSFRAPTFNDLYWPDEGWAKGNPELKPEKGVTREIGLQTEITKYLAIDLTYYRSDYKDLINWGEVAGVWQPLNINSARIEGVELGNKIKLNENWSFDTGYTYLKAKDKDTRKFLVYQPEDKADFCLTYKDAGGLVCELRGQFTGVRFHDPGNLTKVKRFFVLGLNVSKKIKPGVTCFGSINNMLNRKYEVIHEFPMPGFSVNGGVKLEF